MNEEELKNLVARRHPEYDESVVHWNFLEDTYKGGRDWFFGNIFKYLKEGQKEYKDRVHRAYRFNHTKEVVDIINKYIFKSPILRSEDAPEHIKSFWNRSTLSDLDIEQFMSLVSSMSSIFGRIWVFTDTNKNSDILSKSEEKASDVRPYVYAVKPQNILDYSYSDNGEINWVLVREFYRDDIDPFTKDEGIQERFRLWTKNDWYLFTIEREEGKKEEYKVVLTDGGTHGLGVVPGFPVDHVITEDKWTTPGLINDIAYLDRAVANYLSNLDAIIQDQTFSQLVIPSQSINNSGDDKTSIESIIALGTKRIFTYDGEGGGKPEFISPDVKQASIILEVINKIISEIYHSVGMAGERTKQDNSVGIDNSSGVAKAYDFERMNALLVSKAASLQNAENKLVQLISMWHNKKIDSDKELVSYSETFDVRSLYDEFTIAEKLALVEAPKEIRREQMKLVVEKLWPQISVGMKKKIESELKNWLEVDTSVETFRSIVPSSAKPAASNRQGQVTNDTQNK